MKSKGFAGMDRSGSESQLPYVVAAVFSENKSDFLAAYKSIKKICGDYNPVLGHTNEIKAKEINSSSVIKNILNAAISSGLKMSVLIFNEKPGLIGKGMHKGDLLVESVLWFKAIDGLAKIHNAYPREVTIDISFTNTKDRSFFDYCMQKLIEKYICISPFVRSRDSRFENEIKIADLVAGFFRKEKSLKNDYKPWIIKIDEKEIQEKISYLRALVSHEYPQVDR